MTEPRPPAPREATLRQAMAAELQRHPCAARELSALLGIPEKAVFDHLEHLRRSLQRSGRSLQIEPAACLDCGFLFVKRERLTRPGRCPGCRGTHLREPLYAIR